LAASSRFDLIGHTRRSFRSLEEHVGKCLTRTDGDIVTYLRKYRRIGWRSRYFVWRRSCCLLILIFIHRINSEATVVSRKNKVERKADHRTYLATWTLGVGTLAREHVSSGSMYMFVSYASTECTQYLQSTLGV
jgi:hypothetical protein